MSMSKEVQEVLEKKQNPAETYRLDEEAFLWDLDRLNVALATMAGQLANFKVGGTARTLLTSFYNLSCILMNRARESNKFQNAYQDMERKYKAVQNQLYQEQENFEKYRKGNLNIKTFGEMTEKLYRVVGEEGPKVSNPEDLSKFVDFVYNQCQRNTSEPDVP